MYGMYGIFTYILLDPCMVYLPMILLISIWQKCRNIYKSSHESVMGIPPSRHLHDCHVPIPPRHPKKRWFSKRGETDGFGEGQLKGSLHEKMIKTWIYFVITYCLQSFMTTPQSVFLLNPNNIKHHVFFVFFWATSFWKLGTYWKPFNEKTLDFIDFYRANCHKKKHGKSKNKKKWHIHCTLVENGWHLTQLEKTSLVPSLKLT